MTEEVEEVRDPQALLASYNKLKADLAERVAELGQLQKQVESLNEGQMRLKALTAEAKLALQSQGIKDADRLMPYIGTEGLDFDEEGHIKGLDERLNKLKKDLPEVFNPKVRVGGKADIFANDPADVSEDPLRAQVRKALTN